MSRVLLLLALACVAFAKVAVLDNSNFDELVGKGKGYFVKFYAPWCGHCKHLAPTWEELAEQFAPAAAKVVIAEVNADEDKTLASRFEIHGFPTLKWFAPDSAKGEDYNGGRELDDLLAFVNEKAGTNIRVKKAPSAVVELEESNFDAFVMSASRSVIVAFYAPWCGHCKKLHPEFEKAAASFAGEDDIAFVKVDATKATNLATKYGVSGYPTIKWFPKDAKAGEDYSGGREAADFVTFMNTKTGSGRVLGGGFLPTAGRVADFDSLAKKFLVTSAKADQDAVIAEAKKAAAEYKGKYADLVKFYHIAMTRIQAAGRQWVATEQTRLNGMINNPSVAPASKTQFSLRKNILDAFVA